jgi:CheY-like chemotaxis protein
VERAARQERTALVVDDDAFVLSALAEALSEDGYDVHTASNGFSALRQAVQFRPEVILLDLLLPERSGPEVLAELRNDPSTRDLAIVVVTAHPEGLNQAQVEDTDAIVLKPFDLDELVSIVHGAVLRAAARRAEVAPVLVIAHREPAVRARRAAAARRTRGRR